MLASRTSVGAEPVLPSAGGTGPIEVAECVSQLRDGMKIAPLIVLVLSRFRRMNSELEGFAFAFPDKFSLPPSCLSAATAEHGELRSEQR
jgi:hypothetical protein